LPNETVFDNVSWSRDLGRGLDPEDTVELLEVDHAYLVLIHNIEQLLKKWSGNLSNGLHTKNEISQADHARSLRIAHLEKRNVGKLLLHHGVSDLFAHLDHLGVRNVNG
jgi:hypothetical protein